MDLSSIMQPIILMMILPQLMQAMQGVGGGFGGQQQGGYPPQYGGGQFPVITGRFGGGGYGTYGGPGTPQGWGNRNYNPNIAPGQGPGWVTNPVFHV